MNLFGLLWVFLSQERLHLIDLTAVNNIYNYVGGKVPMPYTVVCLGLLCDVYKTLYASPNIAYWPGLVVNSFYRIQKM